MLTRFWTDARLGLNSCWISLRRKIVPWSGSVLVLVLPVASAKDGGTFKLKLLAIGSRVWNDEPGRMWWVRLIGSPVGRWFEWEADTQESIDVSNMLLAQPLRYQGLERLRVQLTIEEFIAGWCRDHGMSRRQHRPRKWTNRTYMELIVDRRGPGETALIQRRRTWSRDTPVNRFATGPFRKRLSRFIEHLHVPGLSNMKGRWYV